MHSYVHTFLLGPLAAFLPQHWRRSLRFYDQVHWGLAAAFSGCLEFLFAVIVLGYWYLFEMNRIAGALVDSAYSGRLSVPVTNHQISGAALMVFAMHPVTWLLVFLLFEATVRVCGAAFSGNVLGTLPLYLFERSLYLTSHRAQIRPGDRLRENADSFLDSIRQYIRDSRAAQLPDALNYTTANSDELLVITASHRKPDWLPPQIVLVDELYYRLEDFTAGQGTRPFRYTLRRLSCGVPSRHVLVYSTAVPLPPKVR